MGGGPNWFSAREGALKVEEESSLLCKAYRPAEYAHNAIPLLSDEVATVVIAPPGKASARLHDAVRTARAALSPTLALVVEGDDTVAPDATFVVAVPGPLGEMLMPPLAAVAFQLLGYYLGAERGYNPDTLRTDDLDHALKCPQFSWTLIRGESNVQGGGGNGSIEERAGEGVGGDGGSPEGDRSARRRRGR